MMPGSWGRKTGGMLQGIRQLAEASEEGLGSKWAVAPMMMMNTPLHVASRLAAHHQEERLYKQQSV